MGKGQERSDKDRESLSTHLVLANKYEVGSDVWMDDEARVWVQAEVLKQDNTLLTLRRKDTGETVEIDLVSEKFT